MNKQIKKKEKQQKKRKKTKQKTEISKIDCASPDPTFDDMYESMQLV